MRAYRCDACHKMFLMSDDNYENDENVRGPAGELYIYKSKGIATTVDLCPKCLKTVVETMMLTEIIPLEDEE